MYKNTHTMKTTREYMERYDKYDEDTDDYPFDNMTESEEKEMAIANMMSNKMFEVQNSFYNHIRYNYEVTAQDMSDLDRNIFNFINLEVYRDAAITENDWINYAVEYYKEYILRLIAGDDLFIFDENGNKKKIEKKQ